MPVCVKEETADIQIIVIATILIFVWSGLFLSVKLDKINSKQEK